MSAAIIAGIAASTAYRGHYYGGGGGNDPDPPPWWVIVLIAVIGFAVIAGLVCLLWACT